MKIVNTVFNLKTKCKFDFIDLTDKVKSFIKKNRIKNGFINIQSLHTTATVFVNEMEPLLLEDFKNHLEKLSPQGSDYNHDDFKRRKVNICDNECRNGHSHCKAIHLPVNIALNLINSEIQLGQWQRILFVELDRSKKRKVQVQIMGI